MFGDDGIGVHIIAVERDNEAGELGEGFHGGIFSGLFGGYLRI